MNIPWEQIEQLYKQIGRCCSQNMYRTRKNFSVVTILLSISRTYQFTSNVIIVCTHWYQRWGCMISIVKSISASISYQQYRRYFQTLALSDEILKQLLNWNIVQNKYNKQYHNRGYIDTLSWGCNYIDYLLSLWATKSTFSYIDTHK